MLIHVAIGYWARVRVRPERAGRTAFLRARVPVLVREFSSGDAPVAATFAEGGRAWSYRNVDGVLFEEAYAAREAPDHAAWLARVAAEGPGPGDVLGRPYVTWEPLDETSPGLVVKRADRDAATAMIAGAAARLALVDGRLWRRAVEPRLRPSIVQGADGTVVVDLNVEYAALSTPGEFRIDHASRVVAYAKALHPGMDVRVAPATFVLVEPVPARHPCEAFDLSDVGHRLLSDARATALDRDMEFLGHYVTLRDAVRAVGLPADGRVDMGAFADLAVPPERTRALRDAVASATRSFPAREATLTLAARALAHWEVAARDADEDRTADEECLLGMSP